jgi:hypothetical protein
MFSKVSKKLKKIKKFFEEKRKKSIKRPSGLCFFN